MITIVVGEAGRKFHAHRDLLCSASDYFKGALHGGFSEASSKVVTLAEELPEVFETFTYWLYSDKLAEPKERSGMRDDQSNTTVRLSEIELVQTWIFGDRRGIPALQDACLKSLHLRYQETHAFDFNIVNHVFDNTPPGANLRQYIASVAATIMKPHDVHLNEGTLDALFLGLLSRKLIEIMEDYPGGTHRRAQLDSDVDVRDFLVE